MGIVKVPPRHPRVGQVIWFEAGPGIVWRLRYQGGRCTTFRWQVLGVIRP